MISFDEALPKFVALVSGHLGAEVVYQHAFLRDAAGRLTFLVMHPIEEHLLACIRDEAVNLAPWVAATGAVATPSELFDVSPNDLSTLLPEWVEYPPHFTGFVRLIERRIVGQDWLRPPQEPVPGLPPVVVFASHKGGVGRSTALSVASSALSREGYNLLVIDLDIEAPGLGAMLLHGAPKFGTLDYFIEGSVSELNDEFLDDMYAPSQLADRGLLHVAPAVGAEGNANPQNVLGKIARAYVEKIDDDGRNVSFLDQTRELVTRLAAQNTYDAIFIDARAGLNESTAAAVLGLGAEVLLFGVDTPQTFVGYKYFLAHLRRFRPARSGENDWRYRLRMVQAKAQADPKAQARFRTRAFELFSDTIYDAEEGIEEDAFNFDYDDITAPHYAWPILNDSNYAEFDPMSQLDQFASHMYERTFGSFIQELREKIRLVK